jgi:hypothetical protein
MQWKDISSFVVVCALVAASIVSVASASPSAARQRIAIDAKSTITTGKTTFVLTSLSGGELESDVGRGLNSGSPKSSVLKRNGQSVTPVVFTEALTGKNGTLTIVGRVESASAGNSFLADNGTWTLTSGTGAYAGYTGGGGVALVMTPNGRLFYRVEGYVNKR